MKFVLISMIKNEERIIERSLKSVENVVDAFCVCDTGSTDRTVEIVNKFLETHVGCITEENWRDFGYNRTLSFVNAQKYIRDTLKWDLVKTYGILLDADMIFVPGKLKEQTLGEIGYSIIQENGGLSYHNCRIVRMDYDWKCIGVTHEYWSGPCENLSKDICYIDDKDDGGCKHDKFERDIKLLEKGLKNEPDNVRYMFYLAQSYNSVGRNKESNKMYKKRIASGGWDEEIWYSHYMIAQNHKILGNNIKFEEWMLRAYEIRKTRAEPLYKLTEHFRVIGQQFKAYEYARIGKEIPYPSDTLFIEKQVYQGLFDYEMSILDYYAHTSNGTLSSLNAMLKCPRYIDNVISNLKFYAKPIPNSKVTPVVLPKPFGEEFNPSAISVINYPYANVRYVNYFIEPNGSYTVKNNQPVITKNAYVNLENSSNDYFTMNDDTIGIPNHGAPVQGVEDIRLFTNGNDIYFTGTTIDRVPGNQHGLNTIRILHGKYNYTNGKYDDCRVMRSPENRSCEKNWLPFSENKVIYDWCPFRLTTIKDDTLEFTHVYETPNFFRHIRGGAPPFMHNNQWFTLVHFVEHSVPRKYYHSFVVLEKDTFKPLKISLPFVFQECTIEFSTSCRKVNDSTFELYASKMDRNPIRVIFNPTELQWVNFESKSLYANETTCSVVRVLPPGDPIYWWGNMSKCYQNGAIESYIIERLNKQTQRSTLIFAKGDGDIDTSEYDQLKSKTVHNTKPIIASLCSRKLYDSMLFVPLDDDTFTHGLSEILSKYSKPNWKDRKSTLFWRGVLSGYDKPTLRERVVRHLLDNKNTDVRPTPTAAGEHLVEGLDFETERCSIEKHFEYKYILIVDGNVIASNHQWVFGSGAVPVMITHPKNFYWFSRFLRPMQNYVPISYDLSDLNDKIEWLIENDDKAQEIAANAIAFSNTIFSKEFQRDYLNSEIKYLLKS